MSQIAFQKEIDYIDTLYLQCNLEDLVRSSITSELTFDFNFIDDKYGFLPSFQKGIFTFTPERVFSCMRDFLVFNPFDTLKHLGDSHGYEWYNTNNYKIGFSLDWSICSKSKNYNCIIQYNSKHLFKLDKNLSGLDLPFASSLENYKIKRIDITKIARSDVDYTKDYLYISPYRERAFYYGTQYLGSRKNGNVFRMYDKTKELSQKNDYEKIDLIGAEFNGTDNLYTFELELHRSYLKESLRIDNLSDLDSVYSAYNNIVGKIKFIQDNDRNKALIASKKYDKCNPLTLCEYVYYPRVSHVRKYDYSLQVIADKVDKILFGYSDSTNQQISDVLKNVQMKIHEKYNVFYDSALIETKYHSNSKEIIYNPSDGYLSDTLTLSPLSPMDSIDFPIPF